MPNDSYTIKEMVQELRQEMGEQSTTLTRMSIALQGVESHLATLNSKVAAHEKELGTLTSFRTQAMMVWAFAVFIITTTVNKFL